MLSNLRIVAQTEKIISLGLKRYWILVTSVYLVALLIYVLQAAIFANYSSFSGSVELVPPRVALTSMAEFCLTIFVVLAVLLSVEVRARDQRDRLTEVLDTRPFSNMALVLGRYLGVLLVCWLPLLLLPLLLQLVSWLLPLFGIPAGGWLAGYDVLAFVLYLALPTLAFSCAVAMLSALILRNRFVAVVLSIALLFVSLSLVEAKPFVIAQFADLLGVSQLAQPSDLAPAVANWAGWSQRLTLVLLAVAALLWMVAVHPRPDNSRRLVLAVFGFVLFGLASGVAGYGYHSQLADYAKVRDWQQHHQGPVGVTADLHQLDAQLNIKPGATLTAEVRLQLTAPQQQEAELLTLTLNPGFQISKVLVADTPAQFSHQHGLLQVTLPAPLAAGDSTELTIHYSGKPDPRFAYLDSTVSLDQRTEYTGSRKLKQLGEQNAIFTADYVALMPGIYWLPVPGPAHSAEKGWQRDFFRLNLTVSVPTDWTVAGPAVRKEVNRSATEVRYQLQPTATVPEVALIAAPFISHSTQVGNVRFEVLLHPQHEGLTTALAPAATALQQWLSEQVQAAAAAGLDYPYDVFSLVDVPSSLRSYQGGWRMDSAMAPPGMVLLPEQGLPSARFDTDGSQNLFASLMGWAPAADNSTDPAEIIRSRLVNYLRNDFSASNVFSGYARNVYQHQVGTTGIGAAGLDDMLSQLTTLVLTGERRYFALENALIIDKVLNKLMESGQATSATLAEQVLRVFSARPSVWEQALSASLNQFAPQQDPERASDVLALKGGLLASLLYDKLGAKGAGELLQQIRSQYSGGHYRLTDLLAEPQLQQAGLTEALTRWFEQPGLAGLTTAPAELFQLAATASQPLRYQLQFNVHNEEAAPGFARVSWQTDNNGPRYYSDPFAVGGHSSVAFGMVLSDSPVSVYLEPYLALNRQEFLVATFSKGNIAVKDQQAFHGVKALGPRQTVVSEKIIADDLDPGFRITEVSSNSRLLEWLRPAKATFKEQDQGLPVSQGPSRYWSRATDPSAYGRFRHTYALIEAGDGNTKALWNSQLPAKGKWYLEIYLPDAVQLESTKLGKWHLEIISAGITHNIEFDGARATRGWNSIGVFDVAAGDVEVSLSNKSDEKVVMADAVAWSPVGSSSTASAAAGGSQ